MSSATGGRCNLCRAVNAAHAPTCDPSFATCVVCVVWCNLCGTTDVEQSTRFNEAACPARGHLPRACKRPAHSPAT
eukprot:7785729-Pyramimonas_sp.AAC.1